MKTLQTLIAAVILITVFSLTNNVKAYGAGTDDPAEYNTNSGYGSTPLEPYQDNLGKLKFSLNANSGYLQYSDAPKFKYTEIFDKKGVMTWGFGGSLDYIFPSKAISLGLGLNLNMFNDKNYWDSKVVGGYSGDYDGRRYNYIEYINDYNMKYSGTSINLSLKAALFPTARFSPYLIAGLNLTPVTINRTGKYSIITAYDQDLNDLDVNSTVSATGSGYNLGLGCQVSLLSNISIYGQISYICTSFNETDGNFIPHRDVQVSSEDYWGYYSVLTGFNHYMPKSDMKNTTFTLGFSYSFGK
jgi:hypothetical protein